MPMAADISIRTFWDNWSIRFGLSVAAIILVVDQLSKWVIVDHVMQPPRFIEVTGFFNLVMVWNRGVSFGMFGGGGDVMRWILTVVALAITVFLVHWLRQADRRQLSFALGLVIGGAIGNAIDRMRFGAVADFLDVHLCFGSVGDFLVTNIGTCHWPAFNVADSAIVIGVGLLLFDQLFGPRPAGDGDEKDRTES